MLGTSLNPIAVLSDVESNFDSPFVLSPAVIDSQPMSRASTGDIELISHPHRVTAGHMDDSSDDEEVEPVEGLHEDLSGTAGMASDKVHGGAQGNRSLVPGMQPHPGPMEDGPPELKIRLKIPAPQRSISADSSPLSSLSSLPDEPSIHLESPAESSKTAAARAQKSERKSAPPKRQMASTQNYVDFEDDLALLSGPMVIYDDDDDVGNYRPGGKKAKSTPKRKVNGARGDGSARRKRPEVVYAFDLEEDLSYLDDDSGGEGNYRPSGNKKVNGTKGARKPAADRKPAAPRDPRDAFLTDAQIVKALKGKDKEVQMGLCMRPRYSTWGKCVQCISKAVGDRCRFKGLRTFPLDPDTAKITGPGYFEDTALPDPMTPLPTEYNTAESLAAIEHTESAVAPILLPILLAELRHVVKYNAIRREVDSSMHRSLCDFCQSTIFAGYWLCKSCGRDYCLQCERYFSADEERMEVSPWPLRPEARPRLQRCSAVKIHFRSDLQPVSRFGREELEEHCTALLALSLKMEIPLEEKLRILEISGDEPLAEEIRHLRYRNPPANGMGPPPFHLDSLYTKCTDRHFPLPADPAEMHEVSHPFMCVSVNDLEDPGFEQIWSRGEPIAVTDVGERLKMQWTPDTIIEMFGTEQCVLVNCQTNANVLSTVEKFFSSFKDVENRGKQIWKLKDWPATEDFKMTHPGLYNDFCDALPVPDYTRREGILNLYCHFPPGPTKPDIGPKMYNAYTARETQGGFGSTRLHMDVADAINLMLYASPRGDGAPGCAVWDLFKAEDADKIRQFLFDRFGAQHAFTDPIHAQLFYLDSKLRRELWEGYGVSSFRIYQYPGQCVFIPAGCAHQVCNLADCIKIALDFVSPHNVSRCQRLTSDFRNENFAKAWKEDVLQLYNVLWFSWLWTREARQRLSSIPNDPLSHGAISQPISLINQEELSRKILQHAIDRPDPPPPAEVKSSIATKWPAARSLTKTGSSGLKRANSAVSENQTPKAKRVARATAEAKEELSLGAADVGISSIPEPAAPNGSFDSGSLDPPQLDQLEAPAGQQDINITSIQHPTGHFVHG